MIPPQGQPQAQAPAIPEGMEQAPPADPTQIQPMGTSFDQGDPNPQEVEEQIMSALDDLEEEDRELLALHLTPEFAQIMRALMGDSFGNVFDRLADPQKILIPLNRTDVMPDEEGVESGLEEDPVTTTEATPPLPSEDTPL